MTKPHEQRISAKHIPGPDGAATGSSVSSRPEDQGPPEEPPKQSEVNSAMATHPAAAAAAVVQPFGSDTFNGLEFGPVLDKLLQEIRAVKNDDMSRAEAMLIAQAHSLQSIYVHMARRALNQDMQKKFDGFMAMAFKAQNQCRMTLETLGKLKNPPVVYAKQANFAAGHQQVNNGTAAPGSQAAPRADVAYGQPEQPPKHELLENAPHGHWMDTGTTSTPGPADPVLAPLGEVHRPEDHGR